MTEYGPKDPNTAAYSKLLSLCEGYAIIYILHHARVSLTARACQWPGSLKVQAVLAENKTITVVQLYSGEFNVTQNW